MTMIEVDGKRYQASPIFVSQEIYEAYLQVQPWNPELYLFVEIGDLLPAWITAKENEELVHLSTLDEIELFVDQINLKPLMSEKIHAWQRGERPQPPTEEPV